MEFSDDFFAGVLRVKFVLVIANSVDPDEMPQYTLS